MAFDENWTKVIGTRLSRRSALRGGVIGGAGLVAAALIGCGDDDDDDAAAPKAAAPLPTSTPKAAATAAAAPKGATPAPRGAVSTGARWVGRRGGVYRRGVRGSPITLDPMRTQDSGAKGNAAQVYSFLFKQIPTTFENSPNQEFAGELAESWEYTPDGLTLNINLVPNAKFTAPINRILDSEDVKFSINRFLGLDGQEPSPNPAQLDFIDSVDTPDARTAVLNMNRQFARALWRMADVFNMCVMPRETGTAFDPTQTMVGSGPFMMDEFNADVNFRSVRNPEWFRGPDVPYFDAVDEIVMERSAMLTQFQAGNIDHTTTVSPDSIPGMVKDHPELRLEPRKSLGFGYISRGEPRDGSAPWDDPRVRHAISMALKRDDMVEAVYNVSGLDALGLGVSDLVGWHNVLPAGYKGQSIDPRTDAKTGKYIQYNLTEAKKLLDAAGQGDGFDVKYHYTTRYGSAWKLEAEIIPQLVKEIGINFQTEVDDYASVYSPKTFRGDFDGVAFQLQAFPDLGDYLTEMYTNPERAGRNHSKVDDPAIAAKVIEIGSTLDAQERNDKIQSIQRDMLIEPMWYIPGVVWQLGWQGFNPRLKQPKEWHGNGRSGEMVFAWPWWWIDEG